MGVQKLLSPPLGGRGDAPQHRSARLHDGAERRGIEHLNLSDPPRQRFSRWFSRGSGAPDSTDSSTRPMLPGFSIESHIF
jgi:hypothetical protein